MGWRYYTQRATSGRWLDTNTQLGKVQLTWALSAPASGKALVPAGLNATPYADDGRLTWGKWDTLLYAEEDGNLSWVGICNAANPAEAGLQLEFIGISGWMQRVPFTDAYSVWKTNAFDVVRMLVHHAMTKPDHIGYIVSQSDSQFTVGDEAPPPKPKEPPRRKGETKSEWQGSPRYDAYQKDLSDWNDKYGDREKFEISWWEAPYVGEEIDQLAKEVGFDYRERVRWADKTTLEAAFYLDLADDMITRRDDIAFVDGINLARAIDPKDGDLPFANRIIALGSGEGRKMLQVTVGGEDGRLYQAEFMQYKSVRNKTRLRALAQADHKILNTKDPEIDSVAVWDVPGFASISTLRAGDEVQVKSQNIVPNIDAWVRITKITRNPEESIALLIVETVA